MDDAHTPIDLDAGAGTDAVAEARQAIEAVILVSDTPVEPGLLAQLLELPTASIVEHCEALAADYEATGRGFVLTRVAGGYRFQTHPDAAPYVERFVLEGQSARLSAAALETLAIVAYKQPLSRLQVANIRGVNVDGVMRTLQSRGLVAEVGRDPGPGNAVLFGTTPLFLERLGLDRLDDLPPLGAFVPGAEVVEALETTLRVDSDDLGPVDDSDGDHAADEGDGAEPSAVADAGDGAGPSAVADEGDGTEQRLVADAGGDPESSVGADADAEAESPVTEE